MAKLTRLDSMSTKMIVCNAVAFFASLVLLCIIGAAGPTAADRAEFSSTQACNNITNCTVVQEFQLKDLSAYNQATWVVARFKRPNALDGTPIMPAQMWRQLPVFYSVSVYGSYVQISGIRVTAGWLPAAWLAGVL